MPEQLLNDIRTTLASARSQLEYLSDLGVESLHTDATGARTGAADRCEERPGRNPRCDSRQTWAIASAVVSERLVTSWFTESATRMRAWSWSAKLQAARKTRKASLLSVKRDDLLDRILQAMGMQREDVYICNVLKCRPPDNRDPQPEEVATCEAFLIRQIAAIKPQVIIGLGRFAVHSLLKSKVPISRIRGEWQSYHGTPLMPTYHPAYLLRNPEGKRDVWEDMKEVMRRLNGEANNP